MLRFLLVTDFALREEPAPPPAAATNARKPFTRRRAFKLGWRILLTLLILTLLLFMGNLLRVDEAHAQSASDPLVLAFYYAWFDMNTWNQGLAADLPAQPYASTDRAVMGRQIDEAQRAGIDGFVVAWYGPGGGNQTESNLAALLEEAAARNFRVGILFEGDSPFMPTVGDSTAAMQHAMNVHANHPAYLRVDGHPVFFFWRTQRYDVGTWQAIRNAADPDHNAIWIADGVDTSYLSLFDGHHLYSNTWSPPADLTATNQKFANQVHSARQNTGAPKLWVATAMPGYNDILARGGFAQDREGGGYYGRSWAAAIASNPNWVVITSYNEWLEGSQIEPSQAWGNTFMDLTATYSSQFKSGGGIQIVFPQVVARSVPAGAAGGAGAVEAQLFTVPEPDAPIIVVQTAMLNIRRGPGADFAVAQMAPFGVTLAITGKATLASDASEWWQVNWNGTPGWVSAEYVDASGPLDEVPTIPTTPEEAAALATLRAQEAFQWQLRFDPFPILERVD